MGEDRHDFSKDTVKRLCDRVAAICSNADCKAVTKGPHSDGEKSVSIGMACHIHAASPGGKRYDANQTEEERRSIHNGIWLCFNCGKLIDTDEDRFHAALLRKWKADAELAARDQLGKTAAAASAPSDGTGGVRMSAEAAEIMRYLRDAYIKDGFRNHKAWNFTPKSQADPNMNELRALGLLVFNGPRNGPWFLSDEGLDWVMRTRPL